MTCHTEVRIFCGPKDPNDCLAVPVLSTNCTGYTPYLDSDFSFATFS
jgi:hypothetical protein